MPSPVSRLLLLLVPAAIGCNLDNPGDAPPPGTLYFPTAIMVGKADPPRHVYVANANFDFKYSDSTLQAYSLAKVDQAITQCEEMTAIFATCFEESQACVNSCYAAHPCPQNCDPLDTNLEDPSCLQSCNERIACEKECDTRESCQHEVTFALLDLESRGERMVWWDLECIIEPAAVMEDEVFVPTHATAMATNTDGDRIYVTSRTTRQLSFVEVDDSASGDSVLRCGDTDRRCSDAYRRGSDKVESSTELRMPSDPVAVVAGELRDLVLPDDPTPGADGLDNGYIAAAHRGGAVSLFVEVEDGTTGTAPELIDVRSDYLQDSTGLAYDPHSHLLYLTNRLNGQGTDAKQLSRAGVTFQPRSTGGPVDGGVDGPALDPRSAILFNAGELRLTGVTLGRDTRSLQFAPSSWVSSSIAPGRTMIAARNPSSLLTVNVNEAENNDGQAEVESLTEVGAGPSRLTLGRINDGTRDVELVIVSCFNSREIYIIDAATGIPRSIVPNLSGPFEVALDENSGRLYVADFSSSVVRILDLNPVVRRAEDGSTSARLEGTIGRPQVIQELQ